VDAAAGVTGAATLGQGSQSVLAFGDVSGAIVVPPGSQPGGAGGGRFRVSFEDADRIRKRLRDIETKRRKSWKDPQRLERQLQQIYEDLYESPHRDEVKELVEGLPHAVVNPNAVIASGNKTDFAPLLKDLTATRQLLDLYQTYLDDEEAVALLLLL
jgi:hypothetical protein